MDFSNKYEKDFVPHACEQVLRFSQVSSWGDLSEAIKIQLSFNVGFVALGLRLAKEDGFQVLVNVREGRVSMKDFHDHFTSLIVSHKIIVDEAKVSRPF